MFDAFKQAVKLFFTKTSVWLIMGVFAAFLLLLNIPWWGFAAMMFQGVVLSLFVGTLMMYGESQIRKEFADQEAMCIEDKAQLEKTEAHWTPNELDRLVKLKQLNEQFSEMSELTCFNCKSKVKASKCIGLNVHYICPACNSGFVIDLSELKTQDNA